MSKLIKYARESKLANWNVSGFTQGTLEFHHREKISNNSENIQNAIIAACIIREITERKLFLSQTWHELYYFMTKGPASGQLMKGRQSETSTSFHIKGKHLEAVAFRVSWREKDSLSVITLDLCVIRGTDLKVIFFKNIKFKRIISFAKKKDTNDTTSMKRLFKQELSMFCTLSCNQQLFLALFFYKVPSKSSLCTFPSLYDSFSHSHFSTLWKLLQSFHHMHTHTYVVIHQLHS